MQFDSFPFEIRSNHLWPFVYSRPPVLSKSDYADTKTSILNSSICKADVACVTESITNGKEKKQQEGLPPVCLHLVKGAWWSQQSVCAFGLTVENRECWHTFLYFAWERVTFKPSSVQLQPASEELRLTRPVLTQSIAARPGRKGPESPWQLHTCQERRGSIEGAGHKDARGTMRAKSNRVICQRGVKKKKIFNRDGTKVSIKIPTIYYI